MKNNTQDTFENEMGCPTNGEKRELYRVAYCTAIVRYKRQLRLAEKRMEELHKARESLILALNIVEMADIINRPYRREILQTIRETEECIDQYEEVRRSIGTVMLMKIRIFDEYLTIDDYRGLFNMSLWDAKGAIKIWEGITEIKGNEDKGLLEVILSNWWVTDTICLFGRVLDEVIAANEEAIKEMACDLPTCKSYFVEEDYQPA